MSLTLRTCLARLCLWPLLLAAVAGPRIVCARTRIDAPPSPRSPVRVSAVRAVSAIAIDGVLDEAAWSTPPATDFLQRDPIEGVSPTESTEVRVVYDDAALYIGVRMLDREAGMIGRRLSRRDEDPDADTVQIYLDPRHDGRSGVMFEVTAPASNAMR